MTRKRTDWAEQTSGLCRLWMLVCEHHNRPMAPIIHLGALCLISLILDFLIPFLLKDLVLHLTGLSVAFLPSLPFILAALFVAQALKAFSNFIQNRKASQFQVQISCSLRSELANRFLENVRPLNSVGGKLSAIDRDLSALEVFLKSSFWQASTQILYFVAAAVLLVFLSPWLAFWACLPIPITFAIQRFLGPRYRQALRLANQQHEILGTRFQELLEGGELIRSYQAEALVRRRFEQANDKMGQSAVALSFWEAWQSPLYEWIGGMASSLVLLGGYFLIKGKDLSPSTLLSFIVVLGYFYRPVFASPRLWENWQKARIALDRLLQSPLSRFVLPASSVSSSSVPASIEVKSLGLSYKSDRWALKDVACVFAKGMLTGITGPNGAGKSTLLKVLAGLEIPSSGTVLWDGKNDWSTRSIAYLPQDPFFFDADAIENLCLTSQHSVGNAEIKTLARQLGLDLEEILNSPQSISLWGRALSGGQRQRLSLLRFALRARDATLCLIDEPTNYIDLASEGGLVATLLSVCRDKTTVIVTHRKWVLDLCDEVVTIDAGYVAEVRANTKRSFYERTQSSNGFFTS